MRIIDHMAMRESVEYTQQRIINADGSVKCGRDLIVREHFMDLWVNEKLIAKLVCTPLNLVELVLGRLLTEGIISGSEDVESVYICEQGSMAKVFLKQEISLQPKVEQEPTCCTGNQVFLQNINAGGLHELESAEWKTEWIFALAHEFAQGSGIHKITKGTHGCYLAAAGEIIFSCEDIGRHNAMDKCIGNALLEGLDRHKCILFTTGRIPTDMVKKAVMADIPVLVSKAVPTDAAVKMAKQYHLTLICKAWPDSFAVYHDAGL